MDKRLKLFLTLATASIAFVVAGSIFNWVVNDQGEGIRQQIYIRGDVGLFLVVPLFIISIFPAARGGYRAILVILGLLTYPIYVIFRETAFAHEHLFIILFVVSASCAFYGIIVGAAIVRNRALAMRETHNWLAKATILYFVSFMLLYIFAYYELDSLRYQFPFLINIFISEFFIIAGILLPFIIYTIVLFIRKRSQGFILAPVLIVSSLMLPLSVSTYRDCDSLIRLLVISSCTLISFLLIVSILWVLPKGDTGQRNEHGTKH